MGTPAKVLSSVLHTVVVWFGVLWFLGFVVARLYAFHEAKTRIEQKLSNDAQLLILCSDPDFVSIMIEHTDVCSHVRVDAGVNVWLKALNFSLNSPTLCGERECIDIFMEFGIWSGWTGFSTAIVCALCFPHIFFMIFSSRTRRNWPPNAYTDPSFKPIYYPPLSDSKGV
eukprot:484698-Rhodomonas_salina.1